jgi:hypothetical protein
MARMLVGLTVFFFLASLGQLFYLHARIEHVSSLNVDRLIKGATSAGGGGDEAVASPQLAAAVALEANLIERRYHQANVLLMSRVWTAYLGFVTGMTLALVGAAFILGQLRDVDTALSGGVAATPVALRTASPGVVLCVLGTALMITTIVTHHDIETHDVPTYFNPSHATDKPDVS